MIGNNVARQTSKFGATCRRSELTVRMPTKGAAAGMHLNSIQDRRAQVCDGRSPPTVNRQARIMLPVGLYPSTGAYGITPISDAPRQVTCGMPFALLADNANSAEQVDDLVRKVVGTPLGETCPVPFAQDGSDLSNVGCMTRKFFSRVLAAPIFHSSRRAFFISPCQYWGFRNAENTNLESCAFRVAPRTSYVPMLI
jgi:hypothetical protein